MVLNLSVFPLVSVETILYFLNNLNLIAKLTLSSEIKATWLWYLFFFRKVVDSVYYNFV